MFHADRNTVRGRRGEGRPVRLEPLSRARSWVYTIKVMNELQGNFRGSRRVIVFSISRDSTFSMMMRSSASSR